MQPQMGREMENFQRQGNYPSSMRENPNMRVDENSQQRRNNEGVRGESILKVSRKISFCKSPLFY